MSNDDTHSPATADGAGRLSAEVITCLICAWEFGTVNGLWDHTRMHMLTPALYGQLSDTAKLRAALATAERERDAYRHAAERNLDRLSALEEIDKEHADCQASIRVLIEHRDKVVRDLAAERERNAPLRAQIKAAQDRADQAKSQIHALNRIIGQASVWVLGNRTDEHVASVNSIIEHVAKYGIDPERINQFRISIHERFKIGLLIEQLAASESRARALREALEEAGEAIGDLYDDQGWMHTALIDYRGSISVANKVIRVALAAADNDGPGAAPSGDEMMTFPDAATAISWLQSDDDGLSAAPSGEA